MDTIEQTNIEPTGSSEINTTPIESDISTEEVIPESTVNEPVEGETTDVTVQEKIKLGEKEYTPDELTDYVSKAEAVKAEQEASQYQPREMAVIEQDLSKITQNCQADYISIQKKALAKIDAFVDYENPETGEIQKGYKFNYTPEQAFDHGTKTGDWSAFVAYMNPIDVQEFLADKGKFEAEYSGKLEYLNQEKAYIAQKEAKKADIGKWDSHITTSFKEDPAKTHFFNKVKEAFDFDEQGIKNVSRWFDEAIALKNNQAELSTANDSAKQAMMNSTITGQRPQGGTKTFTRAEIKAMTPDQFIKNENAIFDQLNKGLIK